MEHMTQHTTEHTIEDSTQEEQLLELDDKQLSHVSGGAISLQHNINVTHEFKLPTSQGYRTPSQKINDGLHSGGGWWDRNMAWNRAERVQHDIRRHTAGGSKYEVNKSWADRLSAKV